MTVGICTKDRWDDLGSTLVHVKARLPEVRIIVIDDGSSAPMPGGVQAALAGVEFVRDGMNRGYIERRNQIASLVKTEFYLSLDDDSYIVKGSLDEAVTFAKSIPDLLCVGFPVVNSRGDSEVPALDKPRPVRHFIGCAHLMHVHRFHELGGYRAELVHQGEEAEIAARGFGAGMSCWQFPGLTMVHNYSLIARNWDRMDFYGARNRYLWNDWFAPVSVRTSRQMRLLSERIVLVARTRRTGHIRGLLAGRRSARELRRFRKPFTGETFARWNSLPTW
ncbi:MAG TPA: glycosyltransferase [Opitutaceae bacterium]|nr:glycosyltransferase [Opitutaceae bacterium]